MEQNKSDQEMNTRSVMDIALPCYEKTPFTPETGPDFVGIKIWAPERISLKSKKRIPLFGVVQLKENQLEEIGVMDKHPLRAVVVGAVAAGVNTPYVGNALLQAPLFSTPPSSDTVTEYFNVDIFEAAGMLRAPGKYFLFASIGPHVGEALTIDVTAS